MKALKSLVTAAIAAALVFAMPMSVLAEETDPVDQLTIEQTPELTEPEDAPTQTPESDAAVEPNTPVEDDAPVNEDEGSEPVQPRPQNVLNIQPRAAAPADEIATCEPGVFYSVYADGSIWRVDVSSGRAQVSQFSNYRSGIDTNGLAIGANGTPIFAYDRRPGAGRLSQVRILEYVGSPVTAQPRPNGTRRGSPIQILPAQSIQHRVTITLAATPRGPISSTLKCFATT